MKSRRDFVQAMPFAAAVLLAACGGKPPEQAAAPAPAPAPEPPAPAPEPMPVEPAAAVPADDPATYPLLEETETTAQALGYKVDATTVDAGKFPTYVAGNICSGCSLYSGAAGAENGPCSLFPQKRVSAKGWCSGFIKKPA